MTIENDEIRRAYERALQANGDLHRTWEAESHATPDGQQAIDEAIAEYNAAATELTLAWNRRDAASQ